MTRFNWKLAASAFVTLLVVLSLAQFVPVAVAQTNHPPAKASAKAVAGPGGNRFLFIVDTSAAMKSGADETLRAVEQILHTSASGQMHPGDTLGVWTFNRQLYPGVLPLQTWSLQETNEITRRTLEFLKHQKYAHESVLPAALDGMFTVIKSSDIITIFLISTGQSPMQGTPFDQQINALYVENLKESKRNHKPVVTVLQARRGKIIRFTVNALPWPVVIPEVPIPIRTAEMAHTEETAPPPAPKIAPPLIVQKPPQVANTAPAPAPAATPPPAATKLPSPPAAPQIVRTTPAPAPTLPQPAPPANAAPPPVIAQNPTPPAQPPAPPSIKPGAIPHPRTVPPAISNKTVAATTELPENNSEYRSSVAAASKPSARTNTPVVTPAKLAATNSASGQLMWVTMRRPGLLLGGAIAGIVVALALIGLLIFRLRNRPAPSLITRTMGNPPKK